MSTMNELREQLAAIEHERWGDWQRWMHGLGVKRANGDLIIPRDCVERWERQIATPYAELSENEKQSDRDQVDRYWPIIEPLLAAPPAPGEVTVRLKRHDAEKALDALNYGISDWVRFHGSAEDIDWMVAERDAVAAALGAAAAPEQA